MTQSLMEKDRTQEQRPARRNHVVRTISVLSLMLVSWLPNWFREAPPCLICFVAHNRERVGREKTAKVSKLCGVRKGIEKKRRKVF